MKARSISQYWSELRQTLSYLPGRRAFMVVLAAAVIFEVSSRLIWAELLSLSLDALLGGRMRPFVLGVTSYLLLAAFSAAIRGVWRYKRDKASSRLAEALRNSLAAGLMALPFEEAEAVSPGELGSRLTSDISVMSNVIGSLYLLLVDFLSAIASLCAMAAISLPLTIASLATSPALAAVGARLSRAISDASYQVQQRTAALNTLMEDTAANQEVVQVFCLQPQLAGVFGQLSNDVRDGSVELTRRSAKLQAAALGLSFASEVFTFAVGGYLVFRGSLSFGSMFAVLRLTNYTGRAPASVSKQWSEIVKSLGAGARVRRTLEHLKCAGGHLETKSQVLICSSGEQPGMSLKLESFSYRGTGNQALGPIDLTIGPGLTFVVGESGSGKSTLLKVLSGVYKAHGGTVTVRARNGQDQYWTPLYVPQNPFLFSWSIRENLLLAKPDADEEDVARVLSTACADFVYQLPQGLDTPVKGAVVSLSGGQRALICIARALLLKPHVLLLDEPGANLDAATEERLLSNLRQAMKGSVLVVATHRLNGIMPKDNVVVIERGRIREQGSHSELLDRGGVYASMFLRFRQRDPVEKVDP